MSEENRMVKDIFMLYELALCIGRSLDLIDNISLFMKTFMTRKNYEIGAVYLNQKSLNKNDCNLILAHPEVRVLTKKINKEHKLIKMLEEKKSFSIASSEDGFNELITENGVDKGEFLVFRLQNLGFIKFYSSVRKIKFSELELNQMATVIDIFSVSITACLDHKRLLFEARKREKAEIALIAEKKLHQERTSFVSAVSHQFRTPLAIIQSNADLLNMVLAKMNMHDNIQIPKITTRINSEIDKMVELMNDLLETGKMSQEDIEVKKQDVNIESLLNDINRNVKMIQKDGRFLTINVRGKNKNITTDPLLIGNALNNLISNAFKYSNESNPRVDVIYLNAKVQLQIKDEGIGLSPSEKKNIFKPFYRSDNVQNVPGTGLGLSIAKRCVELCSGTIQVESTANESTTFTIELPY
ncbi:MAG: HAMP domain-containing histidine kinase [Crocinitomicaceae bacterium]|nr:HAMP domain-containing histidine kinase [Crocinitomicaceae bacterium]